MTQEEKAKAYDEALKEAVIAHKDEDRHLKATLERIFPELKESEDERIRKALIYHYRCDGFLCTNGYRIDYKDIRAWLEKQGKQKSLDDIAKEVTKDKDTATSFLKSTGIINENGELADEYKVEQDEQKPTDQARRAVEIAREEMLNEICEWIEENIGEYCDGENIMFSAVHIENIDIFGQERFINDLKQAMKDE